MPRTLTKLKNRMLVELGPLQDRSQAAKQTMKMGHMLGTIRLTAIETIRRIRQLCSDRKLDEANDVFWNTFQMEAERYLATVRDLQKEEMQQLRQTGTGTASGAAVDNIQMPGMKLTGNILGTSGATAETMQNVKTSGSYMERGRMQAAAEERGPADTVNSGSGLGVGSPLSGDDTRYGGPPVGSLNRLPKLEL